jgi:hypothetical protein
MKRIWLLIFVCFSFVAFGQQYLYYTYFPTDLNNQDWKITSHEFYNTHNNSNYLTNEFAKAIDKSSYLSEEFKKKQIDLLKGSTKAGRTSALGYGIWLKKKDQPNKPFYYMGFDLQQVLDAAIDPNLIKILLNGNSPYAGEELSISNSNYLNVYFNRLKFGMGKTFIKGDYKHTLSGIIGFTVGQNYNHTEVTQGSFYTETNGDYLNIDIQAQMQMSDSAWGTIFSVNGLGASLDLHYSIYKDNDFLLSINVNNLGFINWHKKPYQASTNTSYRFEGFNNDTIGGDQIPDDFTYDNLRNLVFKNPDGSAFSEMLPFDINLSAGKFLKDARFYIGFSANYYPNLSNAFRTEVFATWNIKNSFRLTPIISYSSFNKINAGLAIDFQLWKALSIRGGSTYLNTLFNPEAPLGQGAFISIVFRK